MTYLNRTSTLGLLLACLLVTAGCASDKSAEAADNTTEKKAMNLDESQKDNSDKKAMESPDKKAMAPAPEEAVKAKAVKGGADDVALGGYCPVAYKMADKPIEGKEKFAVDHKGRTYYLANAKAKKAFEKMPDKFAVKYDGWCATGLAKGKEITSDPKVFTVYEGNIYLFSSPKAKKMFEKAPAEMAKKANQTWSNK
jgi:YHS domain-containing protein